MSKLSKRYIEIANEVTARGTRFKPTVAQLNELLTLARAEEGDSAAQLDPLDVDGAAQLDPLDVDGAAQLDPLDVDGAAQLDPLDVDMNRGWLEQSPNKDFQQYQKHRLTRWRKPGVNGWHYTTRTCEVGPAKVLYIGNDYKAARAAIKNSDAIVLALAAKALAEEAWRSMPGGHQGLLEDVNVALKPFGMQVEV